MYDYTDKVRRSDGTYPVTTLDSVDVKAHFSAGQRSDGRYGIAKQYSGGTTLNYLGAPPTGVGPDKGDDAYALQLLGETSPYRSTLSIPVMIKDIVELFTLLRLNTRGLIGNAGGIYLTNRFAIQPLINDIRSLRNIVKLIEQRLREFESLTKHGGLRRRVKLDQYSDSSDHYQTYLVSGPGYAARATYQDTRSTKVYGSLRWKPKQDIVIDEEGFKSWKFAAKQIFDLKTPDAETIWELVPFSWLIDYFTDLGDIFKSFQGEEFIEPHDICIVRKTTSTRTYSPYGEDAVHVAANTPCVARITRRSILSNGPSVWASLHVQTPTWSESKAIIALLAVMLDRRR